MDGDESRPNGLFKSHQMRNVKTNPCDSTHCDYNSRSVKRIMNLNCFGDLIISIKTLHMQNKNDLLIRLDN